MPVLRDHLSANPFSETTIVDQTNGGRLTPEDPVTGFADGKSWYAAGLFENVASTLMEHLKFDQIAGRVITGKWHRKVEIRRTDAGNRHIFCTPFYSETLLEVLRFDESPGTRSLARGVR